MKKVCAVLADHVGSPDRVGAPVRLSSVRRFVSVRSMLVLALRVSFAATMYQ